MTKKWFLILLLAAPSEVLSQSLRFDALFYGGPLIYQSSQIKKSGYSGGLYGYFGIGKYHSMQAEYDNTLINYKDGTQLKQNDFTFLYNNFSIPQLKLQFGGHYISTTDPSTDDGFVILGSVQFYKTYLWNMGMTVYFSNYENGNPSFQVCQFSPKIGIGSVQLNSTTYIYMETQFHAIVLSRLLEGSKRQYYSLEQAVVFTGANWSLRGNGWIGEQMYAVRNGGFTVYNLPEREKGGFGASFRYVSSKKSAITFGLNYQAFQDMGTNVSAQVFYPYISIGVTI